MTTRLHAKGRLSILAPRALGVIVAGSAGLLLAGTSGLGGCASDDEVGTSKTTHKTTVETPEEKTTVTETKTKETKIYPK